MEIRSLPLTQNLTSVHTLSLVVALLLAATSLTGLLLPESTYPSEELRRAFLSNDVTNLLIGLPVLLGSVRSARRGSLLGLLFWPGALFYVTYNAVAYAVAMPLAPSFWANLGLAVISVVAMYGLLSRIDGSEVQALIQHNTPARTIGGILIGFGALFFLMAAGKLAGFVSGQTAVAWPEVAVQIADLFVTPAWVLGGVSLWRRQPFGYVSALGLLFQASMLFVGLLVYFLLQPLVNGVPFALADFVVVAGMSLVCLIPLGMLLRKVSGE